MPNLELRHKPDLSSFRRIAIGTWRNAYDPSVYGAVDLDMEDTLRYLKEFRERTGRRLTVSHMVAKTMGFMLEQVPEVNAVLRWNRIYLRQTIAVFFQVALQDQETGEIDLSGCTIQSPHQKTLLEILLEFEEKTRKVRKQEDAELEKTRSLFKKIPSLLLNKFINMLGFLCFTLNLDLRWAGVPKDPFGSCMVTNIGSLNIDEGYVPLVPYSHVPLLVATGAIRDAPAVVDGKVCVRKSMRMTATFDHRVLDGAHVGKMIKIVREVLENPFDHFAPLESLRPPEDAKALEAPTDKATDEAKDPA
ncbi:MAG: 2-oxo acid dehydrogenase subunit E2 [Planctomycetota bacterium]|jgi:pyruvate dehydrogenase E2 component (dihydrolipoamide acetyltransferase)